jgi:hypothetical protein
MANFSAKSYGTVQYDFRPFSEIRGVIPDPSDDMIQLYHKTFKKVMKNSGINELPSDSDIRINPERMQEYMDKIDEFDGIEIHHKILEIVAELCVNQPSVEDMMTLPYRVRVGFIRHVQKELISPEV